MCADFGCESNKEREKLIRMLFLNLFCEHMITGQMHVQPISVPLSFSLTKD